MTDEAGIVYVVLGLMLMYAALANFDPCEPLKAFLGRREEGIAPLLLLPVVLLLGLGAMVVAHNSSERDDRAIRELVQRHDPSGPVAPIPEPASGLLFGVGGIVVGLAVRRRLDGVDGGHR